MQLPKYKNQTKKKRNKKAKGKNEKKNSSKLIGVERTGKEAPASVESEKKKLKKTHKSSNNNPTTRKGIMKKSMLVLVVLGCFLINPYQWDKKKHRERTYTNFFLFAKGTE